MKRMLLVVSLLMVMLLAACAPPVAADPTGAPTSDPEQPISSDDTPAPTAEPTPRSGEWSYGEAMVESVELLTLESFPLQIHAIVRGVLGDGCTELDEITSTREGDKFKIVVKTARPSDAVCTQIAVMFEETVPLDVYGLSAGTYTVDANGFTESFTLDQDNMLPTP